MSTKEIESLYYKVCKLQRLLGSLPGEPELVAEVVSSLEDSQVQPEDCHAPYFEYHPSWRSLDSKGDTTATEDLNLEEPPELGLEVTCLGKR